MKWLGIIILALALIILGYFLKQPTLVESTSNDTPQESMQNHTQAPEHKLDAHDHDHSQDNSAASQNTQATPVEPGKTGNPHFDQLTPEMQQALKDSLLLEGPMETITHSDGSIELPANGRFTQMPVAVEMPDGTIQIKEYSVIPRPVTKTEK